MVSESTKGHKGKGSKGGSSKGNLGRASLRSDHKMDSFYMKQIVPTKDRIGIFYKNFNELISLGPHTLSKLIKVWTSGKIVHGDDIDRLVELGAPLKVYVEEIEKIKKVKEPKEKKEIENVIH